jgi:hypothetical protein
VEEKQISLNPDEQEPGYNWNPMALDRSTGIKLCSFAGLAFVAWAGRLLGIQEGLEGFLPLTLLLTREGAATLAGHMGAHLIVDAAEKRGRHAIDEVRGNQNRDLHRLIGEAISLTLRRAATDAPGGAAGAAYLNSAAEAFGDGWMAVELTADEAAIGEPAAAEFFAGDPEAIKHAPVLTEDQWFGLVQRVAGAVPGTGALALTPDTHATEALRHAAKQLREHFAFEFWEVAKRAWGRNDAGWAALILRLLSEILGHARDASAENATLAESVTKISAQIQALAARVETLLPENSVESAMAAYGDFIERYSQDDLRPIVVREPGAAAEATHYLLDTVRRHRQFLVYSDDPMRTADLLMAWPRYAAESPNQQPDIIPIRLPLGRWVGQSFSELLEATIEDILPLSGNLAPYLLREIDAGHALVVLEAPADGTLSLEAIRWIRELVQRAVRRSRLGVVMKFGPKLLDAQSIGLPIFVRPHTLGGTTNLALKLAVRGGDTRDPTVELPGKHSVSCRIGESWSVLFHVDDNCYMTLFCRGTTGNLYRLFLHPDSRDSFAARGIAHVIPRSDGEFWFKEGGPAGTESIIAFATREPMSVHFAGGAHSGYLARSSDDELSSVRAEFMQLAAEHRAEDQCDIAVEDK